jgi:hypothetical protein
MTLLMLAARPFGLFVCAGREVPLPLSTAGIPLRYKGVMLLVSSLLIRRGSTYTGVFDVSRCGPGRSPRWRIDYRRVAWTNCLAAELPFHRIPKRALLDPRGPLLTFRWPVREVLTAAV